MKIRNSSKHVLLNKMSPLISYKPVCGVTAICFRTFVAVVIISVFLRMNLEQQCKSESETDQYNIPFVRQHWYYIHVTAYILICFNMSHTTLHVAF